MEKLSQNSGTDTPAEDCDDQQAMKHEPLIIGFLGSLRQLSDFLPFNLEIDFFNQTQIPMRVYSINQHFS